MKKRTRKILLIVCLILFFSLTPVAIFYSHGYRIDWNPPAGGIKITQTGGLFLKIWPRQANISLDSKFKKTTDFFFGSVLIQNLIPKKYKILVEKIGFHPWEKTLEIKEKEVTAAENIILFQKNPNFNFLTGEVERFWFSPDRKKIILKEEGWSLKIYDIEKGLKSHLISSEDIYPGADLLKLEFSQNSKEISLKIGTKEQLKDYVLQIDKTPAVLTEKRGKDLPLENILTYQKLNGEIYYLDNLGYVFRTDKFFEQKTKINQTPFPVLPEREYKLTEFNDFLFLQEGEILYLFNWESKAFDKIFEPLKGFLISPDNKKLVYFSNYEIWILFLTEKIQQPVKKAGERFFLLRLSEKIGGVLWLNSNYLIFSTANKIEVSEIDERDRINIIDFANFKAPEIFFNGADKKLYILSGGNLYRSGALLP